MAWSGRRLGGRASQAIRRVKWWFLSMMVLVGLATGLVFRPASTAILPDPRPLHGAQPFATLLCKFNNPPGWSHEELKPVSYYDRLMVGAPESVDHYWREVSYGAINFEGSKAFGWFQMAKPSSAYDRTNAVRADLDALARDCTATANAAAGSALNFRDYVGLNLVFSECIDRPRGGAMDLRLDGPTRSYRVTWLCPGYPSSQQIVAHEIGHSFGLAHSEDSQGSEYGNSWDLMSNAAYCAPTTDLGALAQQPIAYAKDMLGWIASADKFTANKSGVATIQLDYLEKAREASPGFLLAEVLLPGGRSYTVEARGQSGYDAALPAAGVLIHEVDPNRENLAQLVQGSPAVGGDALLRSAGGWPVGSVYTDAANNVAISVDQQVASGFVVTIYSGALPWPLPHLQQAGGGDATILQWQPSVSARQYEVQVARVSVERTEAADLEGWGATFVTDEPLLTAPLAPGRYKWQVRELPNGSWSPPQVVLAGRAPSWRPAELIAQVNAPLRVAPMVSARPDGGAEVAWASDAKQRTISVTRAAWKGDTWAVEDLFTGRRRGLALSFTPAGDLKVAWPTASVDGGPPVSGPTVALDSAGRAHAIWAGANRGVRGIFTAVVDAHAPSAGPTGTQVARVRAVPVAEDAPNAPKYSPALALDGEGNAQAVWIDTRDGPSALYGAERRADGSWRPGQRLSNSNQAVYGRPAITVDAPGNAYAVWESSVDCGGPVMLRELGFAERRAGGRWQPSITLAVHAEGGRYLDPAVAANAAGDVYVAWGEIRDGRYRLYTVYRARTGHWDSPQVAAEGHTNSTGIAISLAVNLRGDAYLTWAEAQGTATNLVRFAATR